LQDDFGKVFSDFEKLMSIHEQFAEDLALYALGSLEDADRTALQKHLQDCPACRRELEALRGDMALLGTAASGPRPPARSRERLLQAVAREPRQSAAAAQPAKRWWWILVPTTAAALCAALALALWIQNIALVRQVAQIQTQSLAQENELFRAREIVATLSATDALRVTLVEAKSPPQPQGKAIYVRDRGSLIFLASNFKALPAEKAYELWLIPVNGAPIPAGVFVPDAHGSATVINPPLPAGVEAKAFAITVEPQAGSAAPTSAVVMLGAGA
jgi:anti-sigma-K factor RskA